MAPKIALILDDDVDCRTLLAEILAEKKLEVRSFSDPEAYLASRIKSDAPLRTPCVDFILSDKQMPGMDGLEFFEMLQQEGCRLPSERKAIISGSWSTEELARAQKLGCRVFSKPYSILELHAWIDEQLKSER